MKRTPTNFRVFPLGTQPPRLLEHIRRAGCLSRVDSTPWRGQVAFIGAGRVWAIGTLHDVKPVNKGKSSEASADLQGFFWCFDDVVDVEGILCGEVDGQALFLNGEKLEPMFLQASVQAQLNRALGLTPDEETEVAAIEIPSLIAEVESIEATPVECETEEEPVSGAMPPDYQTAAPPLAKSKVPVGQMSLFCEENG